MLRINIPEKEFFNEEEQTFFTLKGGELCLEHSLKAMANWESKWKKPFIAYGPNSKKTIEETISYIQCMTLNDVDPSIYALLTDNILSEIQTYMDDSHTATIISNNNKQRPSREIVTTELIYYWMFAQQIPIECENWFFNRLITLLQICSIKNSPGKKMPKKDIASQYRALNAARLNS